MNKKSKAAQYRELTQKKQAEIVRLQLEMQKSDAYSFNSRNYISDHECGELRIAHCDGDGHLLFDSGYLTLPAEEALRLAAWINEIWGEQK